MKRATKLKIVNWVKRLIQYKETDHTPYIQTKTYPIHTVRSERVYANRELVMQSEDQLKFTAMSSLIDLLGKDELIKYEYIEEPSRSATRIIAEINVILPNK